MNEKRPFFKDEKPDKFDALKVCSATECTGLITVPPENEDELENYMDIYDFGTPSSGRRHF